MASPGLGLSYSGNGTTLVLNSSAFSIVSIEGWDEELPDIENNDLATTSHMAYIPGDLIDHGELVLNVVFDNEHMDDAVLGTSGTVTLTMPLRTGEGTGAIFSGTGWFKRKAMGAIENNARVEGQVAIRFTGGSAAPTWTDGTA